MNDLCIIIPYFGKLPAWMPLFINSCASNPSVDFLIITDDDSFKTPPVENIRVLRWSFSQMQEVLQAKLGYISVLNRPYKLCDYRPCFGIIFSEYLEKYAYWGHCDVDTILGDIRGTLERLNYKQFDRLFTHGHFIIYRNSHDVNTLFSFSLPESLPPFMKWSFVRSTSCACHFDEVGINLICSYYGKSFCKEDVAYDVSYFYDDFRKSGIPLNVKCLVTYEDGHVYGYEYDGKIISKREYMYAHFMRRQLTIHGEPASRYIISHQGFLSINGEVTPELMDSIVPNPGITINAPINKMRRSTIKKLWETLKVEFPVRGILTPHTIYAIWKSSRWINLEGGDLLYERSKWFNGTMTATQSGDD